MQCYLAEGLHLCEDLVHAGQRVEAVVLSTDATDHETTVAKRLRDCGARLYSCSPSDMRIISDAVTPQSIAALVHFHSEQQVQNRVLALDGINDPGNVGTIIRCAAWFGFTDVVLGEQCADLYNPKTMRATMGAAFRINVLRKRNLPEWLQTVNIGTIAAAIPKGGADPDFLRSVSDLVLVIGSEAHGVRPEILRLCTHTVTIPGVGHTESLNAAVAAAILAYESRIRI